MAGFRDLMVTLMANRQKEAEAQREAPKQQAESAYYTVKAKELEQALADQQALRSRQDTLQPYYTVNGERPASFMDSIQPPGSNNFQLQQPTVQDRLGVMQDELAKQGRLEDLVKVVNLDDTLAQLKAKVQMGGGKPEEYYAQEYKITRMKEGAKVLSDAMKKGGKEYVAQILPGFTQAFPELGAIDPNRLNYDNGILTKELFTPDGAYMGSAVYADGSNAIHIVQPKDPKAEKLDEFTEFYNTYSLTHGKEGALSKWQEQETSRRKAGGTNISNVVGGKEDSEGVKALVKELPKYKVDAETAASGRTRLQKMLTLIDSGAAGSQGYAKSVAAPVLELIGIKTKGLTEAQLYQKLSKGLAGSLRLQTIGPGPTSNYEQDLLKQVSGGGATGEDAARELITYYIQEADKKIDIYNSTLDAVATAAPTTSKIYKKVAGAASGGQGKKADPLGIR